MSRKTHDVVAKILLLGNSGVGKTSILLRYSDDEFKGSYISTIGIDYKLKMVEINNKRIKLQIWDTAGQEKFKHITRAYCRGCNGVLFVFDLTDKISFYEVRNWISLMNENCDTNDLSMVLMGNKCDVKDEIEVSNDEINQFADEYDLKYFECSARESINIDEAFTHIASSILPKIERKESGLKLRPVDDDDEPKKKCCVIL